MLMIDPKMVELSGYSKLPHLMHPVVTDMRKAEAILAWAVDKMEERYAAAGPGRRAAHQRLQPARRRRAARAHPARERRRVEDDPAATAVHRDRRRRDGRPDDDLRQGGRAAHHPPGPEEPGGRHPPDPRHAEADGRRDHRPDQVEPAGPHRFQVASRTDSRVVLDEMGADKLLGNGDMLFLLPGTSTLLRGQGTYLSRRRDHPRRRLRRHRRAAVRRRADAAQDEGRAGSGAAGGSFKNRDELYEPAVEIVVRERRGSVSLLQRALGIGYGRAARLIDFMAEDGIVGQYNGSQAREVLISLEDWEAMTRAANENSDARTASATPGLSVSKPAAVTKAQPPRQPRAPSRRSPHSPPSHAPQQNHARSRRDYPTTQQATTPTKRGKKTKRTKNLLTKTKTSGTKKRTKIRPRTIPTRMKSRKTELEEDEEESDEEPDDEESDEEWDDEEEEESDEEDEDVGRRRR